MVTYAAKVPPEDSTPPDDPASLIDFVAHDDLDQGGFEELPQPRERPGLRRWRIPLGIAAVVVVAVAVVLAFVAQNPSATPAATRVSIPSSTTTTAVPAPTTTRAQPHRPATALKFLDGLSASAIAAARTECPRLAPTCVTTGEAPAAVLRAVRAAFPQAQHLLVLSDVAYHTTSGRSLAYRRISARSDRIRIAVEVRAASASDVNTTGFTHRGRVTVVHTQTQQGDLTVEVQATTSSATPPDVGTISRLADDKRLLATG